VKHLQPPDWPRASGYSNGIQVRGDLIFVAGQIGWDADGNFPSSEIAGQVKQALKNIVTVLAEANATPEHIVRLTWFITDKLAYLNALKDIGAAYREVMGKNFPTMSVIQVTALIEDQALVEIEATAVISD
jgi:enamine deaminase RidA (YjgF/YER057c/UK114 family)